jgi:hypothetical protein
MDFSTTNQADAKCRIQKTDGRGLPVPTHSMNDQPGTKLRTSLVDLPIGNFLMQPKGGFPNSNSTYYGNTQK